MSLLWKRYNRDRDVDQLIKAMTIQVNEETQKGDHRLLGEILVDLGFMNTSQVKEVLHSLSKD
jgi:hypothetical protein